MTSTGPVNVTRPPRRPEAWGCGIEGFERVGSLSRLDGPAGPVRPTVHDQLTGALR
jgi:hypothetical protein